MIQDDEHRLIDFLGENPDFFRPKNISEIDGLVRIGLQRGGVNNPYGIPIISPGGIENPLGIIRYLSGILPSIQGTKATDQIKQWAKNGIARCLETRLKTNGNAFEWFMLEILMQTKTHEGNHFERPPFELDAAYATDLIYTKTNGFTAGGKTLGIQITTARPNTPQFIRKRQQVRQVPMLLVRDKKTLQKFGHKQPDTMSIMSIYGNLGEIVRKEDHNIFVKDLGLPLGTEPIHFKGIIVDEAKDIADFLKISIKTWDQKYAERKLYITEQLKSLRGKNGIYKFGWFYIESLKSTTFSLYKDQLLLSRFEIFDPA